MIDKRSEYKHFYPNILAIENNFSAIPTILCAIIIEIVILYTNYKDYKYFQIIILSSFRLAIQKSH